jgi:cell division protein FtsL
MSVTPRTLRAVTMPAAPRLRRTPRPFGTISLFLAATGILGLTSLCYLWQAGQATAAAMRIQTLTSQRQSAQNQWLQLESQVAQLKSYATVMQVASTKYGMSMPADPSTVHQIDVPGPVVTKVVAVPVPVRSAGVRLGVGATDAAVTSWWQEAWVVLYKLLR